MDPAVLAAVVAGSFTSLGIVLTVVLGKAASRRAEQLAEANAVHERARELLVLAMEQQRAEINDLRGERDQLRDDLREARGERDRLRDG